MGNTLKKQSAQKIKKDTKKHSAKETLPKVNPERVKKYAEGVGK